MSFMRLIWNYILALPRLYLLGGAIAIIAIVAIGVHHFSGSSTAGSTPPQTPHVQLESVASLSSPAGPLPVIGTVTSLSKATILAQASGELTNLSVALGDRVAAGEIIAQFQNASQQAAIVQAQGSYDAAEASLANAQGVTAANSSLTSFQSATVAANAQISAQTALQSTYAALDDAVRTKADELFINPNSTTVQPTLLLTIPDSQLTVNLVNERVALQSLFKDAATQASSSAPLDDRIAAMTSDAQTVLSFLNDCVSSVNEAVVSNTITASEIAGFQTSISAARTEVVSIIASLTAAKASYDSAQTSSQSAANFAGSGTQNSIAVAQAQVQVALGALEAAKATLANTIVRSPIGGTIISLPVTQGDYISSFSQIAEVSNPGALEIETYVTPNDAKTLAVGGTASIEGGASGEITSIAPAINPMTGEIQVNIAITSGLSELTDGDTVTVSLSRSTQSAAYAAKNAAATPITIPITAAKITPQGPVVFTVSSSTLVSHPITLGTILGAQVQIVSGLTPEMSIVSDARGLSDGETVVVEGQ